MGDGVGGREKSWRDDWLNAACAIAPSSASEEGEVEGEAEGEESTSLLRRCAACLCCACDSLNTYPVLFLEPTLSFDVTRNPSKFCKMLSARSSIASRAH